MRTLLLVGAAALSLTALPAALSAQSADEVNAANQPAPATTTVTTNPGTPATVTHNPDGTVTVSPNPGAPAVVTHNNPGNLTPPPLASLTTPSMTAVVICVCASAGNVTVSDARNTSTDRTIRMSGTSSEVRSKRIGKSDSLPCHGEMTRHETVASDSLVDNPRLSF